MSLQDPTQKMSKSHPDARSRILITDDANAIRARIMGARTDSINAVSYDPATRPGVSNLLELYALVDDDGSDSSTGTGSIEERARALGEKGDLAGRPYGYFKSRVAEAVVRRMSGIRERFLDVLERDGGAYLDHVAEYGAKKARANTDETMDAVRSAIGL